MHKKKYLPRGKIARYQRFGIVTGMILVLSVAGIFIQKQLSVKPKREVRRFFEGTNQAVNVFFISGKQKGPTLLIFGGIQGDEPAGYVTADRYIDIDLKKGNLIIVPRMNLPAILAGKRNGLSGDMNRLFHLPEDNETPDMKVINLARFLIGKADCVLNLHQGSGFYSPVWIDSQRNPSRWGQCNVIDAPFFALPNGERLELERFAEKTVRWINSRIGDKRYRFHVNNTNTANKRSRHKEQRKSLTYHALTEQHKMAFGLEATKNCLLVEAVKFLTIAINSIIEELGILPEEFPREDVVFISREITKNEKFLGVKISVNNIEKCILPGRKIFIERGDELHILGVEAEMSRGWYARLASSGCDGIGKTYRLVENDKLVINKDSKIISSFPVIVSPFLLHYLEVEIDGEIYRLNNQETIYLPKNKKMKLVRAFPEKYRDQIKVNLKGFVGNARYNDAQDLGYDVTAGDLMPWYSLDNEKTLYRAKVSHKGRLIGELFLKVEH